MKNKCIIGTYRGRFVARLTSDHAQSSYGIPVLVDRKNRAYGPADCVILYVDADNIALTERLKTLGYSFARR